MGNFVKTTDEVVAAELRKSGYSELGKQGNFFVFVNNGKKMNFTEDNKKKLIMTDVVCL